MAEIEEQQVTLRDELEAFASSLWNTVRPYFNEYEDDISTVESTNGNRNDAPPACKNGSVLYVLRDQKKRVLYVGESGESVKNRCFLDGSGAHNRKSWFAKVNSVQYYKPKEGEMTKAERVMVEHALILVLKPEHNQ